MEGNKNLKGVWRWLGRVALGLLCGRIGGLSRKRLERLGGLFARMLWRFQRRRREEMLGLMRQSVGQSLSEAELRELRRAAYLHMGRTLVEFLQIKSLSPEKVKELVRLEGEDRLQRALAAKKGVIILTAHFGNWELLGARLAQKCGPGKFHVIAQPQRDQHLTQIMDSVRQAHGVNVIARGTAARESLRALRKGEVLGILLDIDMKDAGVFVNFMGRPASTPTGAAAFALHTGAAVLPVFDIRQVDGTHVGTIMEPVELLISGDHELDVRENTARFTQIIESQVRSRPEQWVWLPNRWRTPPPK
jgi:KDO2-lipid IV(A) lauroyltransferase